VSLPADVVVIGAGHNGLACACYLARAGLGVTVLEAAETPGGCIHTVDLPDGRGRLELGAYEHGGIRASGVAADLELERSFGLRFHLRDEVTLAPCDDGTALAFDASLERTVERLRPVVGDADADAYRRFAGWAAAAVALLRQTEAGPPPSLRELAALAEAALGAEAGRLLQALLGSASNLVRSVVADPRLQGVLAHWAAHSQQSPADPGTGAGALLLAGGHGSPAARPAGGSRATVDALVRCLEAAGGELRCGQPVTRVELRDGRAALWLSTFVPWRPAAGPWDAASLERAADHAWRVAERALGTALEPVERHVTGPLEWVARHGGAHANPNHVEMSLDQLGSFRPSPSLAGTGPPSAGCS